MGVLLVLNKSYAQDPRAQREVRALVEAGYRIDVFCFADSAFPSPELSGVIFHIFPMARGRSTLLRYVWEYAAYAIWASALAIALRVRRRYHLMQVFLAPEALFLVCLLPKLTGVRVVADWMDLGSELYASKFSGPLTFFMLWVNRRMESVIVCLSDLIIFPNEGFREALLSRKAVVSRYCIVLNAADSSAFNPVAFQNARVAGTTQCRVLFSGTLSRRSGVNTLLKAFFLASRSVPGLTLTILGEAVEPMDSDLLNRVVFNPQIQVVGRVAHARVREFIEAADIGVIPLSNTPFTRVNLPTRIFEFGAARKPVICSELPGVRQYFSASELAFCPPDHATALAGAICELAWDHGRRKSLGESLHLRCQQLSWESAKHCYLRSLQGVLVCEFTNAPSSRTGKPGDGMQFRRRMQSAPGVGLIRRVGRALKRFYPG